MIDQLHPCCPKPLRRAAMHQLAWPLSTLAVLLISLFAATAYGHGVDAGDASYLERVSGMQLVPFMYLGAKHMFTGYDHLLFLAGVIFFLYRMKDVALYVTLFAVGHSATLLLGVLGGIRADAYIVDAIIGLSVVYKAFENMGGFQRIGVALDTRKAVFLFGLVHGFGLSTKLQDLALADEGLVPNMLAFNVGVELGQLAALGLMLLAFQYWRRSDSFLRRAYVTNSVIMLAGFMLFGYQLTGYFIVA